MKIGDRVRIVRPDYSKHRAGDEGVISDHYWSDEDMDCFGVTLDEHDNPDDQGWAYLTKEIKVIV